MRAFLCLYLGALIRGAEGFAGPSAALAVRGRAVGGADGFAGPSRPLTAKGPVVGRVATPLYYSEPPRRMPPPSFDRPDPRVLIAAKPGPEQQDAVFAICGALFLGTVVCVSILSGMESLLPGLFAAWRDYTWPLGLGVIFVAAGVSHFTVTDAFCRIVPPPGCWGGLWRVPAPGADFLRLSYEEYHTYWTGVAEIIGGLYLIGSGFGLTGVSPQFPSALLGMLVVSITPANIYQFTHDAEMGEGIPPIPVSNA